MWKKKYSASSRRGDNSKHPVDNIFSTIGIDDIVFIIPLIIIYYKLANRDYSSIIQHWKSWESDIELFVYSVYQAVEYLLRPTIRSAVVVRYPLPK